MELPNTFTINEQSQLYNIPVDTKHLIIKIKLLKNLDNLPFNIQHIYICNKFMTLCVNDDDGEKIHMNDTCINNSNYFSLIKPYNLLYLLVFVSMIFPVSSLACNGL